jgi:hypothetical protein
MALAEARKPRPWQWGKFVRESTRVTVSVLLWTLHEMGGKIHDPQRGRCGSLLLEEAAKRGYVVDSMHKNGGGTVSQLLADLESGRMGGCIRRHTNGKRTYTIELLLAEAELPPKPHPVIVRKADDTGDSRPAPVAEEPPPAPTTAPSPIAAVTDEPAQASVEPTLPPVVAVSGNLGDVLTQIQQLSFQAWMLSATSTGEPAPPVSDEQAVRLAETIDENNRLRRKVNDQAETIRATIKERDGLRQQVMLLQNNLRVVQEASNGAGQLERNLNKFNGTQRAIASRPEPAIAARR